MIMRQRYVTLLVLLSVAVFATLAPLASYANIFATTPFVSVNPASIRAPAGFSANNQPLTVMLELGTPALTDQSGAASIATVNPAMLEQQLTALRVPVLFHSRTAYNGIAVTATPQQLQALRALPGVIDIHVMVPKSRSASSAGSFVGAPQFWNAVGAATGEGVRIGIIDSGIDYTHATFGGPGTQAAFLANNPNLVEPGTFPTAKVIAGYDFVGDLYDASSNPVAVPDADPLDCAGVGADPQGRISGGHGTHVASIAAGYGVNAAGATYRGPYSGSVTYTDLLVGPGIAPGASLVALKIFGCQGTTTYLTRAIDYALDPNGDGDTSDRIVDVLNISLGSPFGSDSDPDVVAVNRAVEAGVVVVIAAGDSGNTFYVIDSPASARQAIAVGASIDDGDRGPGLLPDTLNSLSARGPQRAGLIKPDLVAPGVALRSAAAGTGTGAFSLSGTSIATPQVAGAAALLRQIYPTWKPEQIKAALMNASAPTRDAAGTPYPPSLTGAGRLDLSKLADLSLLAYAADDPASVGLSFGAPWISRPQVFQRSLRIANTGADTRTMHIEPVLAAQENGVSIETSPGPYVLQPGHTLDIPVTVSVQPQALDFTPDAATLTSQSAGFLRYYLAEHSGIVEVTSTLGARLRIGHAADFDDVQVEVDGKPLASLQPPGMVGIYQTYKPGRRTVRIMPPAGWGKSSPLIERTFDLAEGRDYTVMLYGTLEYPKLALVSGIPATSSANQVLVHAFNANPGGGNTAIDVYLDNTRIVAALPIGESSSFIAAGVGRHVVRFFPAGATPIEGTQLAHIEFVGSAGDVVLAIGGGCSIYDLRGFAGTGRLINQLTTRVPFHIIPKSAAEGSATIAELTLPSDATTFSIELRNTGARNATASPLGAQTPLVSAFELPVAGRSPTIANLSADLRPADVRYVGVTSTYPAYGWQGLNGSNTQIYFGLAGYAAWATPNEVQYRVYISTTGPGGVGPADDVPEYVLVNTSLGAVLSGSGSSRPDDVFQAWMYRILPDGTLTARQGANWNLVAPPSSSTSLDSAPFNTATMILPTTASVLGLASTAPVFNFYVETYARDAGNFSELVDRVPATGTITYDLRTPAVAPLNQTSIGAGMGRGPLFIGVDSARIGGIVNQARLAERRSQDVLLLQHHNAPEAQAQVVTLYSSMPMLAVPDAGPYRLFMPFIFD